MSSLWDILRAKGSADQVAKVEKLTKHAAALLDLVRDTFPTYTLHNHVHAENVVNLMEQLLGEDAEKLSALECAILLLSAYFHDIGMVYTADDRQNITREATFDEYLRTHHEEYLRFQSSPEADESVIEGYCRWRHAERVYDFLDNVPDDLLMWDSVYLRKHLGLVCKSHNDDADTLKGELFDNDFLGTCDLRFCAILLRLADILDFDNSRSPESVYEYLGIGRRSTRRTEASDVEWLKHLNSSGFRFPMDRPREYTLTLVAGPDHPAVESDVRHFLDTIEGELASCQSLLRHCSDRWATFNLPSKVDRKSIVSKGYVFGDFRFKLDRQAILDLFMGENLYSDPSVFFRELLQNAIDATRSRAKLQKLDPVAEGWDITVTDWHDDEGYQWIRIDDNGSGMNRHIVDNYLLRIGKSYYSSPEFQAEILRYARPGERPLVSIGKFGVGLLSCFMLADQVELQTLHVDAQGNPDKPLRMSFHHIADYSFFQTPEEKADPFPGKHGPEAGYRTTPGSSIAVRIDPHKHGLTLDVDQLCRTHLLAARVPVVANGKYATDGKATTDRTTWPQQPIRLSVQWELEPKRYSARIDHDDIATFYSTHLKDVLDGLVLELIPLDFNSSSPGNIVELDGTGFLLTMDSSAARETLMDTPLDQLPNLKRINVTSIADYIITKFRASLGRLTFNTEFSHRGRRFPHLQLEIYPGEANDILQDYAANLQQVAPKQIVNQLNRLRSRIFDDNGLARTRHEIVGRIDWKPIFDLGVTEDDVRSWSHNGIRLPEPNGLPRGKSWTEFGSNYRRSDSNSNAIGAIYGTFWLTDELRPVLDIARTKVREIPFRLYSSINLAIRRSLSRLSANHNVHTAPGFTQRLQSPRNGWTLGEVLTDSLMHKSDGWASQAVIQLDNNKTVSVVDIQRIVKDSHECAVIWPHSFSSSNGLDRRFVRALMYIHLDLVVDGTTGVVKVRSGAKPRLDARLECYSPGTFLPYESDNDTLILYKEKKYSSKQRPPNVHHELIEWFLQIKSILQTRSPALHKEFFTALSGISTLLKESDPLIKLRSVVDRIGALVSGNDGRPFIGELDASCLKIIPSTDDNTW